jgi:hypothetical protein
MLLLLAEAALGARVAGEGGTGEKHTTKAVQSSMMSSSSLCQYLV